MKIYKTIGLIIFLIAAQQLNAQLTLRQVVDSALKVNKSIKAAELHTFAKDKAVSAAWGRYFPQISVDAFYTHLNDDLELNLDPIRKVIIDVQTGNQVNFANLESILKTKYPLTQEQQLQAKNLAKSQLEAGIPHFIETIKEQNFPQAMVMVQQPIFTGGKILAGVDAAKAQYDLSLTKLDGEKEDIAINAINYYLSCILAEQNILVREEVVSGMQKHVSKAEKLMLQGVIPKHNKLRADVALSEAERNKYEAEEKMKIAKIGIISIMENDMDSVVINEKFNYKSLNYNSEYFINKAKENNHYIKSLKAVENLYDAKVSAKFSEYLPTVFGYGFYNVFDHYIVEGMEPKWGIGIGAHYSLFDGLRNIKEHQEAETELEAAQNSTKELERKIELLVRNQFMTMQLAENSYLRLGAALVQAEENVRLNEKRFEEGLGTSLEVIDAQLSLESIKLKRIQSLCDYYKSIAMLYNSCGETEKFLEFWYK